jgi:DNA polymerase (family 10)
MTGQDDLAAAWRDQTLAPALARRIEGRKLLAGEHPSVILDGTAWAGLPDEWYDRDGVEDARPADWAGLVAEADIHGILHNHSTWSDGAHTLEEMALHVRDAGYAYFAICDHSRSAFYANGLSEERVLAQMAEIDRLNAALAPFRIYKGIESDILGDGALDYPDEILQQFELVVASVHSNLRMDEDKATARLIRAIENPYAHILGHPTGRLLLARPGYPIDHRKVIDACAANGVAIELNANPLRLDVDHTWIPYCMERGVPVSINPDAHSRGQVRYVRYGVMAARRGGLKKSDCLNARDLPAFEAWRAGKR